MTPSPPVRPTRPQEQVKRLRPSFAGMVLMAAMLFVNAFSGSVLGGGVSAGLVLVWLVLLVLGFRWFMQRPWRVLALPLVDFAVWLTTVLLAGRG